MKSIRSNKNFTLFRKNYTSSISSFLVFLIFFVTFPEALFAQCGTGTNKGSITPTSVWQNTANTGSGQRPYWSFTAVAGGVYSFSNCSGTSEDTYLRLYNSSWTQVASNDDNGPYCTGTRASLDWTCTASGTYYIFLSHYSCNVLSNNQILSYMYVAPLPPPSNDDCANAIPLTVGASCNFTQYTNANATASTGVPAPGCANYLGGDVWFSAVVPSSGQLTIDSDDGVITDGGMAIYSGGCASLSLIECDDDDSPNGAMPMIDRTGLTPGSTVYIRFWEYGNNNNGTFSICVHSILPQQGQDCGWAPTICSDAQINGNSDGPGNIDDLNSSNTGCLSDGEHQSQWFYFQAQADGEIAFTINPDNGTDDYDFAIWSGVNCPPSGSPVRCSYAASYLQLENGTGPEIRTFTVNNGDVITTDYHEGYYPSEEEYIIYDHNGTAVLTVGWWPWDETYTVSNCPTGDCEYQVYLYDSYGDGWDGYMFLYVNGINPFSRTGLEAGSSDNSEGIWGDGLLAPLTVTAGQTFTVMVDNYYATTSPYTLDWVLTSGSSLDCTTLPVDLLSFMGECNNGSVRLEWETATETNNDYFTVEKSYNAIDYFSIGTVKGAGNSNLIFKYSLVDNGILQPNQYYRLSQTDFDGKTKIYDPVSVSCNSSDNENISIRYFDKNKFELTFEGKEGNDYSISICDALGRILYNEKIQVPVDLYYFDINASNLDKGLANIIIYSDREIISQKFVIR